MSFENMIFSGGDRKYVGDALSWKISKFILVYVLNHNCRLKHSNLNLKNY